MRLKAVTAALLATGVIVLGALPAFAHDVTPDNGSQCTGITTGEVKFNATNMGSEQRDIFVYLGGNLVGQLLDFTGNGSHKVDITVPAGLTGDVTFTWSTDAVSHPPANIVINWDKPKCQPEVTTTTLATTTTMATTTTEATTTTAPTTTQATTTTMATTTTAATTTLPTTTTMATTTVPVTNPCPGSGCPQTTPTTTAATTTVAPTTTVNVPPPTDDFVVTTAAPAPPTVTPAEPELPHTGGNTEPLVLLGVGLLVAGAGVSYAAARKR